MFITTIAADDQRDQRDGNNDSGNGRRELIDLIAEVLRVHKAKRVFFAAYQFTFVPQYCSAHPRSPF